MAMFLWWGLVMLAYLWRSPTREHVALAGRRSMPIDSPADVVLLAAAHRSFREYDFSRLLVPLVDTRNALSPSHRPSLYFKA